MLQDIRTIASSVLDVSAFSGLWAPTTTALLAVVCMVVLTPLVIRLARRVGWVAYPQEDRWHDRPVALMGGIAIFGATVIALVVSGSYTFYTWPIWVAETLVFFEIGRASCRERGYTKV